MDIIVHDTAAALDRLLAEPLERRPGALKELLGPMWGPGRWTEGADLVDLHHRGGGMRVDRDDDRYAAALRRMREAGLWEQVAGRLAEAWAYQREAVPGIRAAGTLNVYIMLGDPDNDHLVRRNRGYFGMGGVPGVLYLLIWPTEENLGRLGHCAVHELNHNIRYHNVVWDPATVTLGEHVVSEGLADAFVREMYGPEALGHWVTAVQGEALEAAYATIVKALGVTGMHNFTAYVLGDGTAELMGQTPVGLPDNAGYPVGLRIVDAHLAASGLTAARSIALSREEILANAGL
ncbi:hypothetical protein GCM10009530_24570 [Microbispora corallina]|uniref:DUF2268 domain-containing protein n=1 Tax=Microbispora corallina TaxID=83302 RepID=A0ABQ4G460_9ACTN|nr:DUF2268 domain-containing putative Zn-dependent protease [Microbispora corallina]GIH41873.1 hypothetical protein Mco01_48730 [Microbispora corallina]